MQTLSMKILRSTLITAAAVLGATASASSVASMLVVDRGLPTNNLNNQAAGDRSNVGWDFAGFGWFAGDDFTIAGSGQYLVDSIRFWIYPGANGAAAANNNADTGDDSVYSLSDTYESLSFFLGSADDASVPLAASGNFVGGNATDNADISISRVLLSGTDGEYDYQGSSSSYIQVFQVELTNLGLWLQAGQAYQFGAECRAAGDTDNGTPDDYGDDAFTLCFMHAANSSLAGSSQDGADDQYRAFYAPDVSGPAQFGGFQDSDGNGWDKSSDIGIQVFATQVPEPASAALLLAGIGLLGARLRR